MKPFLLFLTTLFICSIYSQENQKTIPVSIKYRVTIFDTAGNKAMGYFAGFNDTSLLVLPEKELTTAPGKSFKASLIYFPFSNMVDVQFTKIGLSGNKALKAGLFTSGATMGFLISLVIVFKLPISDLFRKVDATHSAPIVSFLWVSSITGGIGALLSSGLSERNPRKLSFAILSSKENFELMKRDMQKR
jgi:hypothetical protein